MNAKLKCTLCLIFFLLASSQSFCFCIPNISIQKLEVNAVMAPSALGKSADIKAKIKIIEMIKVIKIRLIQNNLYKGKMIYLRTLWWLK